MDHQAKLTTRKIVFVGLMAALTCIGSYIRVAVPVDIGGNSYFHLGNIFCALSGILLGPWLGGLAAGLGSAIFDMFYPAFISEAWLTFLMKGAYGLAAGLVAWTGKKEPGAIKALLATVTGALTYAVLYLAKSYFYGGLLIAGLTPDAAWLTVLGKLPATIFNAVVAVIFAPILAIAINKALKQNHLALE
ncbi:MAG: ECF transporter S component [Oscillospiraceae bacterium]|nr:ECF transporter S component [Oscillospiraceae bacterium]